MAYSVHNFQSGDKLYASQLNQMDSAIKAHNDMMYYVRHWNLAEDGELILNKFMNPSSNTVGKPVVFTNSSGFYTVKIGAVAGRKYYFLNDGIKSQYPTATGYNGVISARFACFSDKNGCYISGISWPKPSKSTNETVAPSDTAFLYVTFTCTGSATTENIGNYWVTHLAENKHSDTEHSTLTNVTNWNLVDNDDTVEYTGYAVRNTDQNVGTAVVKSSAGSFRTIRVDVSDIDSVYFKSANPAFAGTGYNGGNAARFAVYADSNDCVISAYSYPQPYYYAGSATNVSIVPATAKWLYITDSTTDNAACKDDRSNIPDIWVTDHLEGDHVNVVVDRVDYLESVVSDMTVSEKLPDVQIVRKPTFSFIFDDGTDGDVSTKSIFDKYGFKCGFAILSTNSNTRYNGWQDEGFEILSHSVNGTAFSAITDSTTAESNLKESLKTLKAKGYDVAGWVTPSSQLSAEQLPIVKKYYQFGFGFVSGDNQGVVHSFGGDDIRQLKRWSLESNTVEDTKSKIDECLASGGFMCFYGHSFPGTDNNLTYDNMTTILAYLKSKVDDEQAYVLPPREAINNYYSIRWSDVVRLLS